MYCVMQLENEVSMNFAEQNFFIPYDLLFTIRTYKKDRANFD